MNVRILRFAILTIISSLLAACGGGGGSDSGDTSPVASSPSAAITYTASASAGELITYSIDTTALTYSYTIEDSAWGLTGQSGSGTLIRNVDGTYTPSEAPNTRLVIGDGVMVGAIRQVIGGITYYIPIYGVTGLVTSLTELAGTYNYIMRSCSSIGSCTATHGTFEVNSNGTWQSCRDGDITKASPTCSTQGSGTLAYLGGGKFQITGTNAVAFATKVNTSKVIVVDYYEPGLGQSLIGISQSALSATAGNGTWFSYSPTYSIGAKMTVSGDTSSIKKADTISFGSYVVTQDSTTTFARNSPWSGMISTSTGYGVVDGNGALYGFVRPSDGYVEYGIRMQ